MEPLQIRNTSFVVLRVGSAAVLWSLVLLIALFGHDDSPSPDGRPPDRSGLVLIPLVLLVASLGAAHTPTSVTLDAAGARLRRVLWPGRQVKWDQLPWVVFTTSRGSFNFVPIARLRRVSFVRPNGNRFYIAVSWRSEDRLVTWLERAGMGDRVARRDPRP